MIYRAIFGIFPMIVIALFVSGAIPISSVLPGPSSSVRSEQSAGAARGDAAREAIASRIGHRIGVRPDEAIRLQEEFRKTQEQIRRSEAESRAGVRREGWGPKGGWGRSGS